MELNNRILIINGPNLNLLGIREPEVYGNQTFEQYFNLLKAKFTSYNLDYYQTNHEGNIIDKLHLIGFSYFGIILNAGAFTHYSYAISDAIAAINSPVVEVHISNIYEREDFRKVSVTKMNCIDMIYGKGLKGYELALEKLISFNQNN